MFSACIEVLNEIASDGMSSVEPGVISDDGHRPSAFLDRREPHTLQRCSEIHDGQPGYPGFCQDGIELPAGGRPS